MDLYSLELFIKLADTLHYGKTSQQCNISRSALSRQIQRLEDEAGQALFYRDNRSVALTPAGRRFYRYAAEVCGMWKSLQDEMLEDRNILKGEISLYCSVTACYSVLPGLLTGFRKLHPGIHIKLRTGDASEAIPGVLEGRADVAVAARPDTLPSGIEFKEITGTPLLMIVPGGDWEFSSLPPEELPWAEIPMILPERELARSRIERWFREKGIKPNIYAEVSGNEAILAMVNLGLGAGVIPELVFEKRPFEVNVKPVAAEPALEPYSVGICIHRKRMASPLIRAFLESVDSTDG